MLVLVFVFVFRTMAEERIFRVLADLPPRLTAVAAALAMMRVKSAMPAIVGPNDPAQEKQSGQKTRDRHADSGKPLVSVPVMQSVCI